MNTNFKQSSAYEYLKQGAIVPVTMDAIRDLVELGKQQADRIAELKKQCEALADEYAIQVNEVCKLTYEIEQLTPQTKPLSDEEIDDVLESLDVYIDTHAGVKLFARAIEERHGIK